MKKIRLASVLQTDSVIDGKGLRCVVWTQGCPHGCVGCHNVHTQDPSAGFDKDVEELKNELAQHHYHDGITFSGGEAMRQALVCTELAKTAHELKWNVWCYTGYTYENLIAMNDPDINGFLQQIDVLVDGRFILELKSMNNLFRGSSNQRLIDVQASLISNQVINYEN